MQWVEKPGQTPPEVSLIKTESDDNMESDPFGDTPIEEEP